MRRQGEDVRSAVVKVNGLKRGVVDGYRPEMRRKECHLLLAIGATNHAVPITVTRIARLDGSHASTQNELRYIRHEGWK